VAAPASLVESVRPSARIGRRGSWRREWRRRRGGVWWGSGDANAVRWGDGDGDDGEERCERGLKKREDPSPGSSAPATQAPAHPSFLTSDPLQSSSMLHKFLLGFYSLMLGGYLYDPPAVNVTTIFLVLEKNYVGGWWCEAKLGFRCSERPRGAGGFIVVAPRWCGEQVVDHVVWREFNG
jgi:hypothetical protein